METNTLTVVDIMNLVESLALINLGYLSVAVTILVLLGFAFHIFNVKPLLKQVSKISKQEKKIVALEARLEKDLEKAAEGYKKELQNLSKDIKKNHYRGMSEHGKSMTYAAAIANDYDAMFLWGLHEAYWYYVGKLANYNTAVPEMISRAEHALEQVVDGKFKYDIDQQKSINSMLTNLRPVAEQKIDRVATLLKKKSGNGT